MGHLQDQPGWTSGYLNRIRSPSLVEWEQVCWAGPEDKKRTPQKKLGRRSKSRLSKAKGEKISAVTLV